MLRSTLCRYALELRTCSDESLTSLVASELSEVLDEAASEVFCLLFPLSSVSVSVARIEDVGVNTGELCGHYKVEVRDNLCGSLVDRAIEDSVDDATGILDRDTLAGTVPTCVYEVCGSTVSLHLLNQLFTVLCGVQAQESCAEAS